jgi:hypothetical protein
MTTLAVMKQRIADELARSDLTAMIAYAISDAIKHYQSKRFFFNESRDVTFDTVADQEFYDKYDHSSIPNLYAIDYAKVNVGDGYWDLERDTPGAMEVYSPATGQPYSYTFYDQQLRLYPVPETAYTILIAAHIKIDEPADDDVLNNAWMTNGERLIRSRAKVELARNVNAAGLDPSFSNDAITIFGAQEMDAFNELKSQTAKKTGRGKIKSY